MPDSLDPDGFHLRTEGSRLFVTGGPGKGTLYVVYELLEKYLGCRFCTSVKKKRSIMPVPASCRIWHPGSSFRRNLKSAFLQPRYVQECPDRRFCLLTRVITDHGNRRVVYGDSGTVCKIQHHRYENLSRMAYWSRRSRMALHGCSDCRQKITEQTDCRGTLPSDHLSV